MRDMDEKFRVAAHSRWTLAVRANVGSNAALARFLGVSESTIRRWNNPSDSAFPTVPHLIKCCHAWDVSPTWLFWGVGPKRISEHR